MVFSSNSGRFLSKTVPADSSTYLDAFGRGDVKGENTKERGRGETEETVSLTSSLLQVDGQWKEHKLLDPRA